ncbi:T9SS type A sorting domain-containing protein [Mariniflexile jejuense]|uniref:T9SS type A sorting domain-containing protein n=1 Tax=Mariniflexile jejuense TaxID=1173582 RepID=A0ABW3JI85_9FLAO
MKWFTLILLLISTTKVVSQISNVGILKISPSTIVSFQNEYSNKSTGTHNNEGQLYLNSNFINNGITSVTTSGTTYFNSTVNTIQTISGTSNIANFYNLEINNILKGVSVANNFGLIVKNSVNLNSGDLRLVGEAQLIQTHTGANINIASTGKLLKDQQGASSVFAYNYYSSPVTNNTNKFSLNGGMFDGSDSALNSFTPQQILFNTGSPYNGAPAILDGSGNVITSLKINDRWLYTYPQSTTGYSGWTKIDQNTLINPGLGFSMKNTGIASQNYVFKGIPNDGDYIFSINIGQSVLLGNPYASSIDIDKFISDNISVLDKVQFWVDGGSSSHYLSDYLGGYSVYNLTGGVAPSIISSIMGVGTSAGVIPKRYMAVGQGFFVDAISTGNITFNNTQRSFKTKNGIDSNFYKLDNKNDNNSLNNDVTNRYIRIGYENPEMFHRQLLLGFLSDLYVNKNFNLGYDAFMPEPREDELFYIIENDITKKYVIQGTDLYSNLNEFPLGLIIKQPGNHTIMLDDVENFTDTIFIKDTTLNITYNLSETSINLNLPPGEYLDRFKMVFKPAGALSINESFLNTITVYTSNNNLIISNKKLIELNSIVIFNTLGQKIVNVEKNELNKEQIILPFSYQKGMYLVNIDSTQGKKTYKIKN